MAWKNMVAVLVVAAVSMATLPAMARATQYEVGDDKGWSLAVNYTDWARDKVFVVGDSLVFKYQAGDHSVLGVNGTNFKACNKIPLKGPLKSGNDTVQLTSPGRKWYICGKADHCKSGQKLVINVLESVTPPAAPPAPPAAVPGSSNKIVIPEYQSLMVAATVALLMMAFMV